MKRLRDFIALLAGLTVAVCGQQWARADPVGDRMLEAFRGWAREFPFERAQIVVIRNGEVVGVAAAGRAPANAAFPIASLSKLITGLCITRFVEAGRISYQTSLGQALARLFAHTGAPVDSRFRAVTIAQLLTHTSGFTDDMTKDVPKPDSPDAITRGAARKQITHPPGSRHQYANANFAILDRVIEELSGQRYDVSCRRMVLDPVGAGGASLFHDYRPPPTWVDWKFSPQDFGRLMRYLDSASTLLRIGPDQWPKHDFGNGRFYGPGVAMRRNDNGTWTFSHSGGYTWNTPQYRLNYGTHFVYWGQRAGYFLSVSLPRRWWAANRSSIRTGPGTTTRASSSTSRVTANAPARRMHVARQRHWCVPTRPRSPARFAG
jgi:CubicO group peptidase (beta-lactamase class C family)